MHTAKLFPSMNLLHLIRGVRSIVERDLDSIQKQVELHESSEIRSVREVMVSTVSPDSLATDRSSKVRIKWKRSAEVDELELRSNANANVEKADGGSLEGSVGCGDAERNEG